MFKFSKFPKLEELHKKFLSKEYHSNKALIDIVDKNKLFAQAKFDRKMKAQEKFDLIYEYYIFRELVKIKPDILNLRTNSRESWGAFVGNDFDILSDNKKLLMILLVEENGGVFRLSPEFYE